MTAYTQVKSDRFCFDKFSEITKPSIQCKFTNSAEVLNKFQKIQKIRIICSNCLNWLDMSILASEHDTDRYLHANLLTMAFMFIYGFMQFVLLGVFTLVNWSRDYLLFIFLFYVNYCGELIEI